MVLLSSVRIPRVPTYSGYSSPSNNFAYGTVTPFGEPFQTPSAIVFSTKQSPYPPHIAIWSLGCSNFARHYFQNRFFFLFLRVMRCFSSPGSPDSTIDSYYRNTTLLVLSSLIRISADLRSFATPHSFSQLVTSFFGAMYQGILLYALCSLIFSWYISISPSFILDSYKKIQNKLCYTFIRINLILSCMNICLFLPSVL